MKQSNIRHDSTNLSFIKFQDYLPLIQAVKGKKSRFCIKVSVMMAVKFIKIQWIKFHTLFQIARF